MNFWVCFELYAGQTCSPHGFELAVCRLAFVANLCQMAPFVIWLSFVHRRWKCFCVSGVCGECFVFRRRIFAGGLNMTGHAVAVEPVDTQHCSLRDVFCSPIVSDVDDGVQVQRGGWGRRRVGDDGSDPHECQD